MSRPIDRLLEVGDRVIVRGAAGVVYGLVLEVKTTADLPALGEMAPAECDVARGLLADNFELCALISHKHQRREWKRPQTVCFFALRDLAGLWWDVRGQQLTLELSERKPNLV